MVPKRCIFLADVYYDNESKALSPWLSAIKIYCLREKWMHPFCHKAASPPSAEFQPMFVRIVVNPMFIPHFVEKKHIDFAVAPIFIPHTILLIKSSLTSQSWH